MRRRHHPREAAEWGRRQLMLALSLSLLTALALLVGFVLSIYYTVRPTNDTDQSSRTAVEGDPPGVRDVIAERPMPTIPVDAARPGPLSTERFDVLVLPSPRALGPAGVATGLPHTKEGALAQLVAIDQAVLQSASVPGAQAVISAWAVPGGPTAESWSGVRAVAEMLTAAGLPAQGSPTLTVTASPAMGLIKGTAGRDYVVACVDFVVSATVTTTSRVAAADCQRMVWVEDSRGRRWMVGAGAEPAQPPSVWPGTEAAHEAGYQELRYE